MKEKLELVNLLASASPALSHHVLHTVFEHVEFEQFHLAYVHHGGQWFPLSFNDKQWELGYIY